MEIKDIRTDKDGLLKLIAFVHSDDNHRVSPEGKDTLLPVFLLYDTNSEIFQSVEMRIVYITNLRSDTEYIDREYAERVFKVLEGILV